MFVWLQKIRSFVALLRVTDATRAFKDFERSPETYSTLGTLLKKGIVDLELPRIQLCMRGHDMRFEIENAEKFMTHPKIREVYEHGPEIVSDKMILPVHPGSITFGILCRPEEVKEGFRIASTQAFDEPLATHSLEAFVFGFNNPDTTEIEHEANTRTRRAS